MASILHLGNLEFAKGEEIDTSILKDEKFKFHLQMTAELLMCVYSFDMLVCFCLYSFDMLFYFCFHVCVCVISVYVSV